MEREELSYGNIVGYRKNTVRILEVTKSSGITVVDDKTGIEYMVRLKELQPIPITIELIRKLGFIDTTAKEVEGEPKSVPTYNKSLTDTSWEIEFQITECGYDLCVYHYGSYLAGIEVEYFHQVQNILAVYNQKISYV